mmetsp:Transcript_106093/g.253271  ORF Transcript_106093/g.253271 Transcript_106093/m.253271 type:complete len:220 (+) Transcript_106093:231-890(+)
MKMPSSRCRGICHRWGAKSMRFFGPMGKFSSLRRGCSTMSTSSIMHTPFEKISRTRPSSMVSFCRAAVLRLARRSLQMSRFSTNRKIRLLTSVGLVRRMWPSLRTASIRSQMAMSTSSERSQWNMQIRFWMMEENTAISTPRQNSSKAEGTTRLTRRLPLAKSIDKSGLTTVVFPAPMIICFTPLSPPSTVRWKSEMIATCRPWSILLSENSKTKKWGS